MHHAGDGAELPATRRVGWLTRQKMAVRMQLAERDFEMGRYYEQDGNHSGMLLLRTGVPAVPGTKYPIWRGAGSRG